VAALNERVELLSLFRWAKAKRRRTKPPMNTRGANEKNFEESNMW
jgi:hypothetical protein